MPALQFHGPGQLACGGDHRAHGFRGIAYRAAYLVDLAGTPCRHGGLIAEDDPQVVQLRRGHRDFYLDRQRGDKFHAGRFALEGNRRTVTANNRHGLHHGYQLGDADQRQRMRGPVFEQGIHDGGFQRREQFHGRGDSLRCEQPFELRKHSDSLLLDG